MGALIRMKAPGGYRDGVYPMTSQPLLLGPSCGRVLAFTVTVVGGYGLFPPSRVADAIKDGWGLDDPMQFGEQMLRSPLSLSFD
jgi:hypothetical protein